MKRLSLAVPCVVALAAASLAAGTPDLPPVETRALAGWTAYTRAAEVRIDRELGSGAQASAGSPFLALDFAGGAGNARRTLSQGRLVLERMRAVDDRGAEIHVPGALVHHWRGAVLIPGATVERLLHALQETGVLARQEDVLAARVLERGPDSLRVFLKLQRSKFVTVVYNTEHAVRFARHAAGRASSRSTAVKIAELTANDREVAAGDDRGFLWRWQAYWRYEQTAAGVLVECESISLSRGIPAVVGYVVRPLVESTARESMERTLLTLRKAGVGVP